MKTTTLSLLLLVASIALGHAQQSDPAIGKSIGPALSDVYLQTMLRPGKVIVDSIAIDDRKKTVELFTNLSLSYIPMREDRVVQIYDSVRAYLPEKQKKHLLRVFSDGQEISNLIPNFYRSAAKDKSRQIAHKVKVPLKTNLSSPAGDYPKGLSDKHIALWQSHGWYYEQKLARWEWQRARIFQTVEDLYTQSYVLPFLVPMLENAGANVLMPRERDYNRQEIIVDNDSESSSEYSETTGKEPWGDSSMPGFANPKPFYVDGENPFGMGTARQTKTIAKGGESVAEWIPDIPEKGKYGVYVSYQTVKNSTDDALYTVRHAGGETDFSINQQMGGGTWIFLGYFDFEKGKQHKVTLSNKSKKAGRTVTADAVKIGGGMGNMARLPHNEGFENTNTKSSETSETIAKTIPAIEYRAETSGYPRYTEGSRYWLQWAGAPDSVYNKSQSKNDYTDDYQSRPYWVNWLAGGSSVLPKDEGLNIPVDLAMAFHTDAGTFWGDTIVGTLGIYMTHFNNEHFENGKSRWASRDLSELIMQEITGDIRRDFEPNWTRRHLWNRSYAEARVPNVPTMLLELLSHQNFADMRYGLDPTFRFAVSRAIYKGMLKFVAGQYNQPYVVQPLPVRNFSVVFSGDSQVRLSWEETPDAAEPTAKPTHYIVYTRMDGGGFDNGVLVSGNRYDVKIDGGGFTEDVVVGNEYATAIQKDRIYGFKVTAVNGGGESFPSEILSVCRKSDEKGTALIVNGFTRVSAPFSFTTYGDSIAGFFGNIDNGVPYVSEHQFIGPMHEFRRVIPWMDDDASGFGDSDANYETTAIAGNTFDYPFVHGLAFAEAGYSFVSCSAGSMEKERVRLSDYKLVDWILGKQRESSVARGAKPPKYKTFSQTQQQQIAAYCNDGGNIIVSGAFVGTDLWDNPHSPAADKEWAQNTLKFKWRNNNGAVTGRVKAVPSPFASITGDYNYYNELNSESYVVENPDAIEPATPGGFTVFRYSENNLSAGVFYKGDKYSTCVLGFPIEAVKGQENRNSLLKGILEAMASDGE